MCVTNMFKAFVRLQPVEFHDLSDFENPEFCFIFQQNHDPKMVKIFFFKIEPSAKNGSNVFYTCHFSLRCIIAALSSGQNFLMPFQEPLFCFQLF